MTNQLAFISDVIYHLKMEYGASADFYRITNSAFDAASGQDTITKSKFTVLNVIRLPGKHLLEAGRFNFLSKSGSHDTEEREIIVDGKDLPSGYTPQVNDYIVFDDSKYTITEVIELDLNIGFTLKAKVYEGEPLLAIVDETPIHYIPLSHEVTGVVE